MTVMSHDWFYLCIYEYSQLQGIKGAVSGRDYVHQVEGAEGGKEELEAAGH